MKPEEVSKFLVELQVFVENDLLQRVKEKWRSERQKK